MRLCGRRGRESRMLPFGRCWWPSRIDYQTAGPVESCARRRTRRLDANSQSRVRGTTPIHVIERAEAERIWRMIVQIDSGVANYGCGVSWRTRYRSIQKVPFCLFRFLCFPRYIHTFVFRFAEKNVVIESRNSCSRMLISALCQSSFGCDESFFASAITDTAYFTFFFPK